MEGLNGFEITTLPKIVEEIFTARAKRNELLTSGGEDEYFYATRGLWCIIKPYIAKSEGKRVEEIEEKLETLDKRYFYQKQQENRAGMMQEKVILNTHGFRIQLIKVNERIDQLLFDSDILGGKNGNNAK